MASAVAFQWNQRDVEELRDLLTQGESFLSMVGSAWNRAGLGFIGYIVRTQMRGRPGLNVGHGQLSRSWYPNTVVHPTMGGGEVISRVLTDTKYARIHQYGGIIVPRRAKALAFTVTGRVYASSLKNRKVREIRSARTDTAVVVKKVRIPKRLHVLEAFRGEGIRIYARELRRAMNDFRQGNRK